MARFNFRLEKLLTLRVRRRQEREMSLAQALQAVRILDEQLMQLAADRATNRNDARKSLQAGPLNVDRLLDADRYELLLNAQERHLLQQRERVLQEVDRRRQALVEADRQVKILEKLRDKQKLAFVHEEQRREMIDIDEIAQHKIVEW